MMATNVIQGKDATLYFKKETFVPFVCVSEVSIDIDTATESVFTIGDGIWDKQRPSRNSYSINLSGIAKFDNTNFSTWDIITNQIGWVDLEYLLAFEDDAGNIKSFSGFVTVQKSLLTATIAQVVRIDETLQGNGLLKFFDGLIPCNTSIDSITVTNPTQAAGNIVFTYTYTGAVAFVKYRLDSMGPYVTALVTGSIEIDGVSVGNHTIEIIPVCANAYEGTSNTASFTATHSLTCSLAISSITHSVSGSAVTWTLTFPADPSSATLKYRIDGGAWIFPLISLTTPMDIVTTLAVGVHTFEAVPICANGVEGTGNTDSATVTSGSLISTINYNFTAIPGGSPLFQVYVNGALVVNLSATGSGAVTANNGDTVRALIQVTFTGRDMTLRVQDNTLVTVPYNHSQITGAGTVTDQFIWTANGDTFTITGTISP